MLPYKLAKQLKDAGFPQKPTNENKFPLYCVEMGTPWREGLDKTPEGVGDYSKIPTLSELIEACGEGFGSLDHFRDVELWRAYGDRVEDPIEFQGEGKTPEEVVARLWLKLYGKQ